MSKYNATISIDRDVWDAFKNKCNEQDTNATVEINAFIKAFMLGEAEYASYDDLPVSVMTLHDALLSKLESYIDIKFENAEEKIRTELKKTNDNLEEYIMIWLKRKGIDTGANTDTSTDVNTGIDTDTDTDASTEIDTDVNTGIDTDTDTDASTEIDKI